MIADLDILLVNSPSPDPRFVVIRDVNRSGRMTRERMIWPQTNLAYLSALVRGRFSVRIIDCIAVNMRWDELERLLCELRPRYVVSNVISATLTNDMRLHALAKRNGAVTIAMGPHVTDLPKESLEEFPYLDFVIKGEPEMTFVELIDVSEGGGALEHVKGLAFRQDGQVVVNPDRPFIENLDSLPLPDHDLLPLAKYRMPFFGNYTFIIAGRGCPFRCIFCRQNVMWRSVVRMRSAESIFNETQHVLSLGCRNIMYQADTFTAKREIVIGLCRLIIDSGIKFRWACNTHIATIDEEMVRLMKQAGCWMIAPGIESCNQQVLDNIHKKTTVAQIRKVVNMIHDAGIEVWGYFVFGLPGDTRESLEQNIRCATELPLDIANFAVGAPYPGTPLYKMAKERGWLRAENWEQFDQNWSAILDYGDLTPADIIQAIKKANFRFYMRPRPIKRILKEIAKDPATAGVLSRVVWEHLALLLGIEDRKRGRL